MEYKDATGDLFSAVTAKELAEEIGCSIQTVRQARPKSDESAWLRPPPKGWEMGVARLAERRAKALLKLAEKMRAAAKLAPKD